MQQHRPPTARSLPAGDYWMHVVKHGETLAHRRSRRQPGRRHAVLQRRTIRTSATRPPTPSASRRNVYLGAGSTLMSDLCRPMLTITADTVGRHDTLGGACATESNTVRYALEKKTHARLPRQLSAGRRRERAVRPDEARHRPQHQLLHERAGDAGRRPRRSPTASPGPGKYVEMRAEMDVIVLISNCPQLNNPCNAYNPTPVEVLIWAGERLTCSRKS